MTSLRLFGFLLVSAVALASWALTCAAWRADSIMAGVAPLETRSFDGLRVVTVGTGGAYENPGRLGPCIAVALGEEIALVDAGRGVAEGLRRAEIPVAQPRTVYLSSLLPENTVGLDDLLLTGWLTGRSEPLRLVGPPGTEALAAGIEASHATAIAARAESLGLPRAGARIAALEVEGGWTESNAGLGVEAGALPDGPLPGLAWRFEAEGRSLVVAPVGWAPEAVVAFSTGAGLLVHEAAYYPTPELAQEMGLDAEAERLAREGALHTSIDAVGQLASRAGVEVLVLVRLRPPPVFDVQISSVVNDHFRGTIWIADDGDEIRP